MFCTFFAAHASSSSPLCATTDDGGSACLFAARYRVAALRFVAKCATKWSGMEAEGDGNYISTIASAAQPKSPARREVIVFLCVSPAVFPV